MSDDQTTCKFVTQYDGISRCQDPVHDHGFCRFHREALGNGEIDLSGAMSDACVNQVRRRQISYHGMVGIPVNPDLG